MPCNSVLKVRRNNEASSEPPAESQDSAASRLKELVEKANARYVCRIKDQLAKASPEKLSLIKERFGEVDYCDSDKLCEVENILKEEQVKRLSDQLY